MWETQQVNAGEVHVRPIDDLVDHELDEHCACGPFPDFTPTGSGDAWVYVHHSLRAPDPEDLEADAELAEEHDHGPVVDELDSGPLPGEGPWPGPV